MASRWDTILTQLATRVEAVSAIATGDTLTGRRWPESPDLPGALMVTGIPRDVTVGPGWRALEYPVDLRIRVVTSDKPEANTTKTTLEGIVEDVLDECRIENVDNFSITNLVSVTSEQVTNDETTHEYAGVLEAVVRIRFSLLDN